MHLHGIAYLRITSGSCWTGFKTGLGAGGGGGGGGGEGKK